MKTIRLFKRSKGFTLIELLIVIAIILILIAIALPNFLEAQQRAKIANVRAGMRGIGTAIEAFRTERGVLLIDFWDDGTAAASERWRTKLAMIGRDPIIPYTTFEECYYPLTSPAAYLTSLPIDPFNDPSRSVGFSANEKGLAYIYFDNDVLDPNPANSDHGVEYYAPGGPGQVLFGAVPLKIEEFALLSVGPDRFIERINGYSTIRGIPYSPTNGTNSIGDMVFRSSGIPG
ncbi:MAG: prepilin-type N-terminal cleavage/methylation domain-containing protein [Candidatus Omnitrophica bacterium]|nr:prepilin-type N-terminal cleavage/methylation domain-containing protein [Candidatus Omnitrophota bacterium]